MLKEDNNTSKNFKSYKKEDYVLNNKNYNIKKNHVDLISTRSNTNNARNMVLKHTF